MGLLFPAQSSMSPLLSPLSLATIFHTTVSQLSQLLPPPLKPPLRRRHKYFRIKIFLRQIRAKIIWKHNQLVFWRIKLTIKINFITLKKKKKKKKIKKPEKKKKKKKKKS